MSKIGKQPIIIPSGVTVTVDKDYISTSGSKGQLKQFTMPGICVRQDDNILLVTRSSDDPGVKAKHGLMRSLLSNMVTGVNDGYDKKLELNGVGYRANMSGADLKLSIGLSHDITYKIPSGITVSVEQNIITINGIDKQQVGQVAAEIRSFKKPEPYKGKGIKYVGEHIIRKSGKSGKEKSE